MDLSNLPIESKEIIKIDDPSFEPSGVTYNKKYNELFVVSDNGRLAIVNLDSLNVEVFNKKNRDYEGMSIDTDGERIFVVEEGKDNIIEIDREFNRLNKFDIPRDFQGKKVLKKGVNGLESLAFYKYENNFAYFFSANQKYKKEIKKGNLTSLLLLKADMNSKTITIEKVIPLKICDISGMALKDKILYLISDTNNMMYLLDIDKFEVIKSYNIPGINQEGIAFDDSNHIYLAQDSGDILKVKISGCL